MVVPSLLLREFQDLFDTIALHPYRSSSRLCCLLVLYVSWRVLPFTMIGAMLQRSEVWLATDNECSLDIFAVEIIKGLFIENCLLNLFKFQQRRVLYLEDLNLVLVLASFKLCILSCTIFFTLISAGLTLDL